jgi:hypothetical protein
MLAIGLQKPCAKKKIGKLIPLYIISPLLSFPLLALPSITFLYIIPPYIFLPTALYYNPPPYYPLV